jgi:hypothetical protein
LLPVAYTGNNHQRECFSLDLSGETTMLEENRIVPRKHILTTPRAAAVAGILAGSLFIAAQVLMRLNLSPTAQTSVVLMERAGTFTLVLRLVPFAGIFFLWFLGVTRDRLGEWEDKFFSTIFLGSGLLYLGLLFTAAAIGGGILVAYPNLEPGTGEAVYQFANATIAQINQIYCVRMAAVFMISSATMWYRTGVMPRWLALLTFALGLGLLLLINFSLWTALIFPIWMVAVSSLILIFNYRRTSEDRAEALQRT